ncbi:MAG: hypothetical protein A2052_09895 [Deltaproteobacteria bacterium GWA2_54_12]|nr:MAG: hypothetical protein A2052_09895 [Deltaproteobacteria bacterium GWA2_54_12]
MHIVSIKKCGSYEKEAVQKAVADAVSLLGGMDRFVKRGERVLVKPNLLAAKPPEAAVTTHPQVVRAVLALLKDAGAAPVVGDSPGLGSARKAAEKGGILAVCLEMGVELIELKELLIADNPKGRTFKKLEVAREAVECGAIINVPKLKTHAQMYLTMAVKNMFGCVPGKLKPQWHLSAGVQSQSFASMLLDLCQFLSPRLSIMDAVIAMEGNGPGNGEPRHVGLIFAGESPVALDMTAAAVVGASVDDVPLLKAARLMDMFDAEPSNIRVLGESVEGVRVAGFRFPPLSSPNFTERLPKFIDRPLRKALTGRPHIEDKKCTLCGICVSVCPAEVMENTGRIEITYDKCIRCYCCQEMCPEGAISVRDGWLKRLIPGL